MQGETPVTNSLLDTWRNAIFPSPFLDYKERGTKIELTGKEKLEDKDVYALLITPAKGPATRLWMDASTYQPVKTVTTVETAEVGTFEQTTVMSDFREAMWGVVQTVVSELDFDFAAYATEHFGRLRSTAKTSEFHAAFDA